MIRIDFVLDFVTDERVISLELITTTALKSSIERKMAASKSTVSNA